MLIGFVQGYEELKWGISKLNPLCNGPLVNLIKSSSIAVSLQCCRQRRLVFKVSKFTINSHSIKI